MRYVVIQDLDIESGNLSKVIAEVCGDVVQKKKKKAESYVQKHRSVQEQF